MYIYICIYLYIYIYTPVYIQISMWLFPYTLGGHGGKLCNARIHTCTDKGSPHICTCMYTSLCARKDTCTDKGTPPRSCHICACIYPPWGNPTTRQNRHPTTRQTQLLDRIQPLDRHPTSRQTPNSPEDTPGSRHRNKHKQIRPLCQMISRMHVKCAGRVSTR